MSNIEHLIENAISAVEHHKDILEWKKEGHNRLMLLSVQAPAYEIWEMAQYIVYNYKPYVVNKTVDILEEKYGYPAPDD